MYPTVSNVFTATTFEIRKKEMRNDVSSNEGFFLILFSPLNTKGLLISKEDCQAVNSSKNKGMNSFFTTMRRVFVHFLEDI